MGGGGRGRALAAALLGILLLSFFLYLPALDNGFLERDDDLYVTANALIRDLSPATLPKLLSQTVVANFHPLTMLSLAVDYRLFGLNARGYHLENVLWHLANTLLVFLFAWRASRRSGVTALLSALYFGVHPMHVESVAWVAERKDVLYAFWFLAGLVAYYRYLDARRLRWFVLAASSFVLSCLAKPAAVVFPLVLLAVDLFERRGAWRRSLLEKAPLLAISLLFGLKALATQAEGHALGAISEFAPFDKVRFAAFGFVGYIVKFVVPLGLSPFHPYPSTRALPAAYGLAAAAALALAAVVILLRRREPLLFFGVLFYALTVALVLQLVTVGDAITAERYTYLPYVGLGLAFSGYLERGLATARAVRRFRALAVAIPALVLAQVGWFAKQTHDYLAAYKDTGTLWAAVIGRYPGASAPHVKRGHWYRTQGRLDDALADYDQAVRLDPGNDHAYTNRGNVFLERRRYQEALADFNRALAVRPGDPDALADRGAALAMLGEFDDALRDLGRALQARPDHDVALRNRAVALIELRRYEPAIADLNRYLEVKPDDPDVVNSIGVCYQRLGQDARAIEYFTRAAAINPAQGVYPRNRSYANFRTGHLEEARADARRAITLGAPPDQDYLAKLGIPR